MATILVVEDELGIRQLAVTLLRDAGYQVVDFETADQAMAYAASPEHHIDALFTDIVTPGDANGLDLADFFLDTRPNAFVIITSGQHELDPDDSMGQICFVPKPWTVNDLLTAVGNTVRRN